MGVIHKNNAARRKSRLMKAFAKMEPVKVDEAAMVEPAGEAEVVAEPKKTAARKAPAKKPAAKK
jgi:hypothetical protein